MNLSSFLKDHDIVLTIGSGNVSGAVVEFSKSTKPKVLFTSDSYFPVKNDVDAKGLTTHMLSAVHTCLGTLHKAHKRKIRKVQIILSSPWFNSFSKIISINKPAPFTITKKIVDELVSEYFNDLSRKEAGTKNFLVEKNVSHVRLNGYETANPYGQIVEDLTVSVYASLAPLVTKQQIEDEVYTIIHPQEIVFHTFPFVAWSVLEAFFSPKEDVVFVDIGSETTDLLVVRRGSIEKSASLPIGMNHLNRKVATGLDTYPELAHSLVSVYAADLAETSVKEKIKTFVSAFGEEWGLQLSRVFEGPDKTGGNFVPQRAYFVSDKHAHTVFDEVLKKQIADTVVLKQENISQFIDFEESLEPNVFLILAAVYISRPKASF